jgi:hypothetical protein
MRHSPSLEYVADSFPILALPPVWNVDNTDSASGKAVRDSRLQKQWDSHECTRCRTAPCYFSEYAKCRKRQPLNRKLQICATIDLK